MTNGLAYILTSDKPFDTVVANIEKATAEHMFRVLHVHDVQATLAEKGFERGPLKIIEVCNSAFAYKALEKDINVALFMPCRFTVHTSGNTTVVTLGRPTMISQMLPTSELEGLAKDVEETLKKVMEAAV